jgi:hypothetical protein
VISACGSDSETGGSDAGAGNGGSGGNDAGPIVTYYQDAAPIFQKHCMRCHQEGGIGPFSLADYDEAKAFADVLPGTVGDRLMPPWPVTADGSCGTFSNVPAVSDEEIATLAAWAEGGALEGTPTELVPPPLSVLSNMLPYQAPQFTPERQGADPLQFNESRCFVVSSSSLLEQFISGYDVKPGNSKIVDHVLVWVIDPQAPSTVSGETNDQRMQALVSAERSGWSCTAGTLGDGIVPKSMPVVWGKGQGIVHYPEGSGIPLLPLDKVVIQVQYNLDEESSVGQTDQTTVYFELAREVSRIGTFVTHDAFLDSLAHATPDLLPAGQKSAPIHWQASLSEMGLDMPEMQLQGVMPIMQRIGRKYHLGVDETCGIDLQRWTTTWQGAYFHEEPIPVTPNTTIDVTCDFDTSTKQDPVSPGWGVRNAMCLAALYITSPAN